jgi:hypothetical protein
MKKHVMLVVSVLILSVLVQTAVPAILHAEKYEKLYDLFGDKKKWKGKDPEGVEMNMPNMKMLSATKVYTKDDSEVTAMIMIGSSAMMGPMIANGQWNFETEQGKAKSEEIDGFMVHSIYDKENNTGGVMVLLLEGEEEQAYFNLMFENLSEKEGWEMAKSFDWKKMKKKVESLD